MKMTQLFLNQKIPCPAPISWFCKSINQKSTSPPPHSWTNIYLNSVIKYLYSYKGAGGVHFDVVQDEWILDGEEGFKRGERLGWLHNSLLVLLMYFAHIYGCPISYFWMSYFIFLDVFYEKSTFMSNFIVMWTPHRGLSWGHVNFK